MFTVIEGTIINERGSWNVNGMEQPEESTFASYEDAKAAYDAIDPKSIYDTEHACRGRKISGEGFYVLIEDADGNALDYKQYHEQ